MNNNKSNTLLLTVIGVATLLVAVIGASFAYFTASISGSETNTTIDVKAGTLTISYNGGADLLIKGDNDEGILPATDGSTIVEKKFTLTGNNTTNTRMPYTLTLHIAHNNFTTNSILYSLQGTNIGSNGTLVANRTLPSLVFTDETQMTALLNSISESNKLENGNNKDILLGTGYFDGVVSGAVHEYMLKMYFPDNGKVQDADKNASLKGNIKVTPTEITDVLP